MGVRLRGEYDSALNRRHKIDIHDSDYSSTVIEIRSRESAAQIERTGKAKSLESGIKSTKCVFSFLIEDNDHTSFLSDIATSPKGRFSMHYYIDDVLEWKGVIPPDQVVFEDRPKPYTYSIIATDGLAMLKDTGYYQSANKNYFDSIADGEFAASSSAAIDVPGDSTYTFIGDVEERDNGDNYSTVNGRYVNGTEDFVGDFFFKGTLYYRNDGPTPIVWDESSLNIKIVSAGTTLAEMTHTSNQPNVTEQVEIDLHAKEVVIPSGHVVTVVFTPTDGGGSNDLQITLFPDAQYYNELPDTPRTFKNIYTDVKTHLIDSLLQTGHTDLYTDSETFLTTSFDWATNDGVTALQIPEKILVPYNAFVTNFSSFPVGVTTAYGVLEAFCNRFNAELLMYKGSYWFRQLDAIGRNTSIPILPFSKLKVAGASGTIARLGVPGQRKAGGSFTYSAPYGEVQIAFKRIFPPDYLINTESVEPGTDITIPYEGSKFRLKMTAKVKILGFTNGLRDDLRHIFKFKVRIGDKWAYSDNLNPNDVDDDLVYSVPTWEDSEEFLYLWGEKDERGAHGEDDSYVIENSWILPPITEDGDLIYSFDYWRSLEAGGIFDGDTLEDFSAFIKWRLDEDELITVDNDSKLIKDQTLRTIARTSSNLNKKVVSVIMSDNTISDYDPGQMRWDDGGTEKVISNWVITKQERVSGTVQNVTSVVNIDELLAYSVFRWRAKNNYIYNGGLLLSEAGSNDAVFDLCATIDGTLMIYNKGKHISNAEQAEVEYIELFDGDTTDVRIIETVEDDEQSTRTGSLPQANGTDTTVIQTEGAVKLRLFEQFDNVTAGFIDVVATLPDPTLIASAHINLKLKVYRENTRLFYGAGFTIDVSGVNNKINFTDSLDDETVYIDIEKA